MIHKAERSGVVRYNATVYIFCSGLCQRRDRKFSISLKKRNSLLQTHEENAVM